MITVFFFIRIMNTFHFTSNEDMIDYNLVLWRSRGEQERRGEERRGEERRGGGNRRGKKER